jgi:hypothetical protein
MNNNVDFISLMYAECALDVLDSLLPNSLKELIFQQMQSELLTITSSGKVNENKKKESKTTGIRIPKKSEVIENNSVKKASQLGYTVTDENKQQLIKFVRMQGAGLVDSPDLEHAIHLFFS